MWFAIIFVIILIILTINGFRVRNKNFTSTPAIYPQTPPIPKREPVEITELLKLEKSEQTQGTFLIIDIETTGLPRDKKAPVDDFDNWPRIVQVAWILTDEKGKEINSDANYIKQHSRVPASAVKIHGITNEICDTQGLGINEVFEKLMLDLKNAKYVVAHNIDFDIPILECEFLRAGYKRQFTRKRKICTMKKGTAFCELPRSYGYGYKYPTLMELFKELYYPYASSISSTQEHNSIFDVLVTCKCFFDMIDKEIITLNE